MVATKTATAAQNHPSSSGSIGSYLVQCCPLISHSIHAANRQYAITGRLPLYVV